MSGLVFALVHRRRLVGLVEVGAAAVVAGLAAALVTKVGGSPHRDATDTSTLVPHWSLSLTLVAGLTAVAVGAAGWISVAWRRAGWIAVTAVGLVRVVTGTSPPVQTILALVLGATVGYGLRVVVGGPDRRIGPELVGDALRASGLLLARVAPARVAVTGSRAFLARTEDDRDLFVKVVGPQERSADLLFRLYRFARLRGVGDARPASSLIGAVEHEALVALMAERHDVRVPQVDRVAAALDGSGVVAMELIPGRSLDQWPAANLSDAVLSEIWRQTDRLHAARIAHRALHPTNIVVDDDGRPWLIDFSFSQLAASDRQVALDVAELLLSLAVLVGPERSVRSAVDTVGQEAVGAAIPLMQPLALSATTRRLVAGRDDLLSRTRNAAAEACGAPQEQLARLERVRPRTLLMIAVLTGAFYFVLPQLAQVDTSWRAFESAEWIWIPPLIVLSMLTYVAGAAGIMGSVPQHLRLGPTLLTQLASSFVNRVSPANVGGMALNARYLEKSGVDGTTSVAAVGVNTLVGGLVHLVLVAIFFTSAGASLGKAFSLPSGSKLLLILAVIGAMVGALFGTRWGRRHLLRRLIDGVRTAATDLREVAASPVKLCLLIGGSAALTLLYIAAFAVAAQAFGSTVSFVTLGAVYLGAAAIAAAAPTPGGLGAIEAALVAGLTGVGVRSGPAVSIVLTYRLATYWLPVAPGWLAWHLLQRWEYV